jgi:hypothetical protein
MAGFEVTPEGSGGHLVIRGGWGRYYSRLASTLLDPFGGGPFRSNETFQNQIDNGVPRLQFHNPFPGTGALGSQSISPVDKNLVTPWIQQWNLTVEREISASIVVRGTYRGFLSGEIPYGADISKPMPSADAANRNFFRYPNFFQVRFRQDGGIQKLHALDLGVERKFAAGLAFQAGWTWGKNLSDVGNDGESADIENPYDRAREMADITWMPRHRFTSEVMWEIPFGSGKRWGDSLPGAVRQILGNWELTAVTIFQTGPFLTPTFASGDPSNTRTVGGRPDRLRSSELDNPTINQWFDPVAFAVPPNGRFGNSARGVIVGPGLNNIDFGLFKYFRVTEGSRLQVRMTSTNFFNHQSSELRKPESEHQQQHAWPYNKPPRRQAGHPWRRFADYPTRC